MRTTSRTPAGQLEDRVVSDPGQGTDTFVWTKDWVTGENEVGWSSLDAKTPSYPLHSHSCFLVHCTLALEPLGSNGAPYVGEGGGGVER